MLYDKNARHRAFPASMTKVLTAILLMEHTKPEDQFTFSQLALDQRRVIIKLSFSLVRRLTAILHL